ncbi:MAG TPA: alpha/beta hydrolase [Candidatus Dormibacteraeota bacterium]|nr:alpha/beta hydrolase [Candidatus Dormibacteraeota bacterium]
MNPTPSVRSQNVRTKRLKVQYIESGPSDGVPVVMIHGNLSTGRFFQHLMPAAPDRYRIIAPDMRGFGDTERVPIDATRGLRDWADDTYSLVESLGISRPVHLVGWSTGGAAIANYAEDRPVASLTFIDTVSPYGFGGVRPDGTPCFPDYAGSGGGTGNPEFTQRIADQDASDESPFSPRNVINTSYWAPSHREPKKREDMLVAEILKSVIGDDGYPGDATPSANWPGIAPGTRGILNALSGKYCNWSGIVGLEPKPPVLWTHGTADIVVADGSAWEMGTLGKMGVVPGWPGEEVFPPQLMVTQIRNVLERYRAAGGHVQMEMFEGSGHGPLFDAAERWSKLFFEFLETAEP